VLVVATEARLGEGFLEPEHHQGGERRIKAGEMMIPPGEERKGEGFLTGRRF